MSPPPSPGAAPVTVAWFHCFSGIAGDMAMASLVDAGADLDEVRTMCERLPIDGWAIEASAVLRNGIAATHVDVVAEPTSVVRTASHITGMIEEARLPERVTTRALAVFWALARAEGHLHRRPPEQVHFHEVGSVDAIIDVVGTCAALEVLGVDRVDASAVANGIGMTRAAHGLIPVPAPAVVRLLEGAPTYTLDVPVELTTPTGAAILAATVTGWGAMPRMTVHASGFGAGTASLGEHPNLTQVVIGELAADLVEGQPVMELAVNVDDVSGEALAHTVAALLDAGAHDAWVTPIVMKKGRPAHTVTALVDPALSASLAAVLTAETGSLGVRGRTLERWPSERRVERVDVDGYPVRVKISPGRIKVEHDDAARVARRTGRPYREVVSLAEESARRRGTGGPSGTVPTTPVPDPPVPDGGQMSEVTSLHDHAHGHSHDHDHPHGHDHPPLDA